MVHTLLSDLESAEYLELNCGNGSLIAELLAAKSTTYVCGVDLNMPDLFKAYETNTAAIAVNRCRIIEADICDLPFVAETFDVVYAVNNSHTWRDRRSALEQAYRVLRTGGCLVLALRVKGSTWLTAQGEDLEAANGVVDILREIGFEVTRTELVECSTVSNEFWIKAERFL